MREGKDREREIEVEETVEIARNGDRGVGVKIRGR